MLKKLLKLIVFYVTLTYVLIAGKGTNYRIIEQSNVRFQPTSESNIVRVVGPQEFLGKKENDDWIKIKAITFNVEKSDNTITEKTETDIGYIHKSLVKKKFNWTKFIKFLFWGYVIFSIFMAGKKRQCPHCKKFFALKKIGKEYVDSDGGFETVTRTDTRYNNRGDAIGTTERKEQIHVTTDYYRILYRCKKCGKECYENTSHTYEG